MNILEIANKITSSDRPDEYGEPLDDFTKTAAYWSILFGVVVKPEQVPLAMILMKMSREQFKHKKDNLVDIAGYARTKEKVHDKIAEINASGVGDGKI